LQKLKKVRTKKNKSSGLALSLSRKLTVKNTSTSIRLSCDSNAISSIFVIGTNKLLERAC